MMNAAVEKQSASVNLTPAPDPPDVSLLMHRGSKLPGRTVNHRTQVWFKGFSDLQGGLGSESRHMTDMNDIDFSSRIPDMLRHSEIHSYK